MYPRIARVKINYAESGIADILMTDSTVVADQRAERQKAVAVGVAVVAYAGFSICIIFITKYIVQVLDFPFSALVLCSQVTLSSSSTMVYLRIHTPPSL